jgi:hypothetical protein
VTDDDLKKMLEAEWENWRPRISMGQRRIAFAVAAMRLAYDLGRRTALSKNTKAA